MEEWQKDNRRNVVMVDVDGLVPAEHLLRKVEQVMDYGWLYERLSPYYCHNNGRNGSDPVVLVKMVLLQHLYGIPSLRQTHQRICDTLSYRWFLGYGLLDEIPHFATVSYAFCKRFPSELAAEIFEHILNKMLNHRMVEPSVLFIDGTHVKASANKKKHRKELVARTAKVYEAQLREEVNAERAALGKPPVEEDDDDDEPPMQEKTVSATDPDSGMFVKGEHERQFAYEAHTACDRRGVVVDVEVTAGNLHDSVAWDGLYDRVKAKLAVEYVVMDSAYKTPWIAKKTLDDGVIPVLPYTRSSGNKAWYKPWEYHYDQERDLFTCPNGGELRHTTTDREGRRTYRSRPEHCRGCPHKALCGANEKGRKLLSTHIWQAYLDTVEQVRKTERGKALYAQRKETIERVFGDGKEKHALRYTQHRGLARVTQWVRLKFAAMNLKKLAVWAWNSPCFSPLLSLFSRFHRSTAAFSS